MQTDFVYGDHVTPENAPPRDSVGRSTFPLLPTREQARDMKSELSFTSWYRPRLLAEQRGPNGLLMTVLAPRRASATPLVVQNNSTHRVFRADIDHGTFTDTIIAALDHSIIRFPDVTGYAEIALIRRHKSGTVINYWTLGGYPLDTIAM